MDKKFTTKGTLSKQKASLEESLTFTNFFLGTYFSAYYVNLKTLECKIYKRTDSLEAKYPIITNYLESIIDYINTDVHPEDRETLLNLVQPQKMRVLLVENPQYTQIFRDIHLGNVLYYKMQVIRGADEDHAAFGFIDVTKDYVEEQRRMLGAVPLSLDVLTKANIGLWAFELDEGQPPRMYADEVMLGLLALDHQIPPEEIYHAWYDNIDEGSYDLVNDAVAKMSAGEHAEVQYPWHNPVDGTTMIVRCGGVRNPEYTKGMRIEGTHQNVSEVLHFDEKELERVKETELQLQHEHLRAAVMSRMIDYDEDPIEVLKGYAERLRVLIGCDQVIYRDLEETRIMVNSPAIEKTWSVPIEYCQQCEHFDAHHPMYAGGYTEMDNCQEGWQGIPVYHDCPIKSSLTRIVYVDGKTAGYLAIHYVVDYHHFTDIERKTVEEFSRILSITLSRHQARLRSAEMEAVKFRMNMIYSLSDEYDPIMVVDPASGEYDWYEKKADEIQELTAMSVHGKDFYKDVGIDTVQIIHDEDKEQFRGVYNKANLMKIAETGEIQYTENRWKVGPNGEYLWKYNKLVRMTDENGRVYVVVGVIDTTEQKKAEAQLERKTVLSDYFLKSYASAYYVDIKNNTLEVLRLLKGLDESLIDQTLPANDLLAGYMGVYTHPEDRERVLKNLDIPTVREKLKTTDEINFIYRDISEAAPGTYRCTIIPGADENHVAIGFQNITEELRQQEEQQKQLATTKILSDYFLKSYAAAYYSDLKNKTLQVLSISKGALLPSVGKEVPAESVVKGVLAKYMHPDDAQRVDKLLSAASIAEKLKEVPEYSFVFRLCYEGEDKTFRCTIIRGADEDHAAVGFQDITEDIREEKKRQQQLEEALSMAQSANRAKTTFLNNMSHDIRTPMNAIIGYTGLAASHIDNKEQVQDYLTKISQSSDHLLSLINDVLDMSRIESGKMNLQEDKENLSDIIHTLRDIVQADIHSKQLEFFVDAVDVNDEDVICDKLRLNQVLLNVLSNAIKYTPSGGTVTMRVREKRVRENGYATYEFTVKDNGMGMDKTFLSTIFDPFTRVKSSTVSGIQGTGLGMAISKNIIDMMGGTIDIESEPNKGTEVTMCFDFKLQDAPKAPVAIPELTGVRGLVVDDDSTTCMSIADMLRDIGMRPEWCTFGKEAVLRAAEGYRIGDPFKVYIIDWLMPDMNGIETTRRIRKTIGDDAPIIILTAYDWSDIEEEAREAGVTAFVSKPMFPSDLHRVLNKCLGKAEAPADQGGDYHFEGKKILLVEDNELNREIATEILEEYGFIIESAEDGDIAVDKMKAAKTGDYDLVLMDVQMPRMNGYEATKAIRALGTEISQIPILAMTANAFDEDRRAAIEAGMNEHIAKPIDINKLKETLAKFL